MKFHNITLVVPEKIRSTYLKEQQNEVLTFSEFLTLLIINEKKAGIK